MKNIIVAIDIEKENQNIIDFALEFAFSTKGKLTFIHIIHPELPDNSSSIEEVLNKKSETLMEMVGHVASKNSFEIEKINFQVDHGDFVESVVSKCISKKADVLIIGISADATKTTNIFSGSAKEILRGMSIPVLFIPERFRLTNIDNLLLPIDFSFEELNPMLDCLKLGNKLDAKVTGIHVWQKDEPLEEIKHNLHTYQRLFKYRSQQHRVHFELRTGDPVEEILNYITAHGIDILCMKVHEYKPLSRFFKPSISGRIAKKIRIPFMIIRNTHIPIKIELGDKNIENDKDLI